MASDIHGKNHHQDGGFADHVESVDVLTSGRGRLRLTPHETPNEFRATAGGMGLTGVILSATIALIPIQTSRIRVDTERAADLDDAMARMEEGDRRYRYSVAWIDCLARGRSLGRSVLTRGDHATLDELPAPERAAPLAFSPKPLARVPSGLPVPRLVRWSTARAFNEMWFRKAPREEQGRLRPMHSFFHPLDGVGGWNRLYGTRGFVQYQFVVPFGREPVVRTALARVASSGIPSTLAVLKRFGPGAGMLSFPVPGWTLALDMPVAGRALAPLLDRLDRLVAEGGGRVYLAKDSRLRPELLAAMYPDLDRWRAARERLDPAGVMRSDLSRRLGLV